ncbi:MAG TPA: type II CAAX endopeptidase family protein [Gemmatimonadaceae bacterium]|nr:type II CAAX endopeptidase family protein [Gemmatimonadaceae bacterium]
MTLDGLLFSAPGRLRAPWRLALFALAVAGAAVIVTGLVYPLLQSAASLLGERLLIQGWLNVLALMLATAATLRWADGGLPWRTVWLGRDAARPRPIVAGLLLGALAIAVPTGLLLAVGWLRPQPMEDGSSVAVGARLLVYLAPLALSEELLTRGYVLAVLREALGVRWAVGLTSVAFGLLHLQNPGASVQSIVLTTLAGVFLGAIVVGLGSLYAGWAAHLAWNWTMAGAFHVPVSGLPFATPDYRLVDAGPDWATGGAWGPEAGAGAAVGMLVAMTILLAPWRRRGLEGRAPARRGS